MNKRYNIHKKVVISMKKKSCVCILSFFVLLLVIIPFNPLETKVSAACSTQSVPIYKYREMYGALHAITVKHVYRGKCKGGNYYKASYVGFNPTYATSVKKSSGTNNKTGWYKINYKFENWTGYINNCSQKQTGSSAKGYTGYSATCGR